jgi:hypothetical protein
LQKRKPINRIADNCVFYRSQRGASELVKQNLATVRITRRRSCAAELVALLVTTRRRAVTAAVEQWVTQMASTLPPARVNDSSPQASSFSRQPD